MGKLPTPPGPPVRPLQHVRAMQRDMLGLLDWLKQHHGPVAQVHLGDRRIVVVTDPALIEQVLVKDARSFTKTRVLKLSKSVLGEGLLTSEGDFHLRQRRMIAPVFHRQMMERYAEAMTSCACECAQRWEEGQRVDMADEMMRLALLVVGRALFGADVTGEVATISRALATTRQTFHRLLLPMAGLLQRLPLPSNRENERAIAELDGVIYRLIDARRAEGASADRGDLLSLLLRAQDEDDGGRMTDKQVRDEALTLLLAGHETTAVALSWTWWLLGEHPQVEAKLHAELDAVLARRPATHADLGSLPYTKQVITEAMRLKPPAYTVGRRPVADYELGGYRLRRGAQMLMPQALVHRDPALYDEPDAFRPERWTDEFARSLPRFGYFPFGGGPRTCIGEGFAWCEAMIVLASLAQHFQPRLVEGFTPIAQPQITLRPKDGMPMTLHRRG